MLAVVAVGADIVVGADVGENKKAGGLSLRHGRCFYDDFGYHLCFRVTDKEREKNFCEDVNAFQFNLVSLHNVAPFLFRFVDLCYVSIS